MNPISSKNEVKIGAILSYTLIILGLLYSFFITPFLITSLGEGEYGVYKTIASFAAAMTIIDFGLGGTVQRYVARYKAQNEEEKIPPFLGMCFLIGIVVNLFVIILFFVMIFLIEPLYANTMDEGQIQTAYVLFTVLGLNMLFTTFENFFHGIITGNNKFVFGNSLKIALLIIKTVLIIVLLNFIHKSVLLVSISIFLTIVTIVAEYCYIKIKLHTRFKFGKIDNDLLKETCKYTFLMFLTTFATQVFSNLDNTVIGSMKGPAFVTVYSVGLLFFSMFQSLSSGIAGVMLPTISTALARPNGLENAKGIIIKAGRVQFMLLGAALVGFVCVGKDFIALWLGESYLDVYIIGIILLVPSLFELSTNVCNSVLRAQNRLLFRTIVVFLSSVVNIVLTILLLNYCSYIYAAVATAISDVVFNLIVMAIYYKKEIGLPMFSIYRGIFKRTWLCLLLSGAALFVSSRFLYGSWPSFILNVAIFVVIYGVLLLVFGLGKQERAQIPVIGKFFNHNQ